MRFRWFFASLVGALIPIVLLAIEFFIFPFKGHNLDPRRLSTLNLQVLIAFLLAGALSFYLAKSKKLISLILSLFLLPTIVLSIFFGGAFALSTSNPTFYDTYNHTVDIALKDSVTEEQALAFKDKISKIDGVGDVTLMNPAWLQTLYGHSNKYAWANKKYVFEVNTTKKGMANLLNYIKSESSVEDTDKVI